MTYLDIWHGELRKFGITAKVLEDGAQFADALEPLGAKLMRVEVPEAELLETKKLLAEAAEELFGKILKEKQ